MSDQKIYNFVLLHGAWHGAWCWQYVATNLTALGHNVTTPVQRGLGERADEMTMDITLSDFVEDVIQHLVNNDLRDVVLVGHSFGGSGISGAADQVPERIAKLVYLDALILDNGEKPVDHLPEDITANRMQMARESSGGISMPPPSAASFGVLDSTEAQWLEQQLTPHPAGTYNSALQLANPLGNGIDTTYVLCNDPIYEPLASSRQRVRSAGWKIEEIATGHDLMVSAPAPTTELLLKIADGHG